MENTDFQMQLKKDTKSYYIVLGGSFEQLPLIKYLKENYKDFTILTFDKYKDSPALNISERFKKIDIRDYKKILIYLKKNNLKVAGISSIITEHSLKTINYLSKKLNLPKTSSISVNATESKYFSRNLFKDVCDGKIEFIRTDNIKKIKSFLKKNFDKKFIMKPDISSGQRGLFFIDKKNFCLRSFKKSIQFSINNKVIIEEYINGNELNVVAMIKNGEIVKHIISERCRYTKPGLGFGIVYNHTNPYKTTILINDKIRNILKKICKKTKIKNGIIFPQFIIRRNKIYLIEFSERVPGGLMNKVFEYSTGIDLNKFQVDISLNKIGKLNNYKKFKSYKNVAIEFLNGPPGVLKKGSVKFIKNINKILKYKNVLEADLFYSGTSKDYKKLKINNLKFAKDRFFYIIYGSNNMNNFSELHKKVLKNIKIIGYNDKSMLNIAKQLNNKMKFKNYTKRSIKPRENGVTSLINLVMSIEIMKSYVQENHYLIDYKKYCHVL